MEPATAEPPISSIDRPQSNTPLTRDIIGGITTLFTMSYIVVVNPGILASPGTGMAFSGVLTATVVLAFSMTLMLGLYARLPFAVAPGMGLNAFFAFTIVQQQVPRGRRLLASCSGEAGCSDRSATPLREQIAMGHPCGRLRLATSRRSLPSQQWPGRSVTPHRPTASRAPPASSIATANRSTSSAD